MKCFYCGSEETYKSGHKNGKQKYMCKTCKRSFVYPRSEREREPKPLKTHAQYVREWRAKRKGLPYEPKKPIIIKPRKLPSIESLIGIPCFACEFQNNCNPNYCQKLENYLLEIDRKTLIIEVKA